jgi:hypothetical protein
MATQSPGAVVPLLHRILGLGLLVLAVVMAIVRARSGPLLQPDDPAGNMIMYFFAGIALVMVAVARLVLKPRVPARRLGQSPDDYWSQPAVAQRVFAVWFTLEGAAIMTLIGYFMVGSSLAAVVASVAAIMFWMTGPRTFDRVQG